MTTAAKLYGKDLSVYDDLDVDTLLSQLTPEEISLLAKEVDPDDNLLPPSQRCSYDCEKEPTGPLDRKKLIDHINKQAMETPDMPEAKPYVAGVIRGRKWVPPPEITQKEKEADEQIAIDLGDEYETALSDATQEEIIDLAAILGFHSMMNQEQYHASLLNSGQPVGLGWDGITKATQPKAYPAEPPNPTDVDKTIRQVENDDHTLTELNWNNIKTISDEKFEQLFAALKQNTHLEALSMSNTGLTDHTALVLAESLERNNTLRVLNVESNLISPQVIVRLVKALLKTTAVEEFRASNQRSQVLGNKIEMEITALVEANSSLLRLGLHLEYNDARHRVAQHLQRNIDRKLYISSKIFCSIETVLAQTSGRRRDVYVKAFRNPGPIRLFLFNFGIHPRANRLFMFEIRIHPRPSQFSDSKSKIHPRPEDGFMMLCRKTKVTEDESEYWTRKVRQATEWLERRSFYAQLQLVIDVILFTVLLRERTAFVGRRDVKVAATVKIPRGSLNIPPLPHMNTFSSTKESSSDFSTSVILSRNDIDGSLTEDTRGTRGERPLEFPRRD